MPNDLSDKITKQYDSWKSRYGKNRLRDSDFTTVSNMEVPPLSFPKNTDSSRFLDEIGFPGSYPYTRGIYDSMYRGKLWTMRQFAGFGTPEDTNKRFRFLLQQGQTGLSTAFDMPVLMGYDCDSKMARGEVGKEGVSISTLEDMDILFRDIDLGSISTSMTVNATASILLAMYLVVAERKGIRWDKLRGTIQNDMLKEFIAQSTVLESGICFRISHQGSRIYSGTGTCVYNSRWYLVRTGIN